jgi:hypothetical protein
MMSVLSPDIYVANISSDITVYREALCYTRIDSAGCDELTEKLSATALAGAAIGPRTCTYKDET